MELGRPGARVARTLAGRAADCKATPKGMAPPAAADFRYLLEQLGAIPSVA